MAAVKFHIDHQPASLTIGLVGGGSGGHITPLLAVAEELKKIRPDAKLVYIGQTRDKLLDIPGAHKAIDNIYSIRAGKFRRYHGEGLKQLLDIKTFVKNVRDFFYVLVGTYQAFHLLGILKPSAIFIRGGYVGVPVGLAARLRHIPYITHDSDAIPSLANKIIAKRAALNAVALPKSVYAYPAEKTFTVGVPINTSFAPVSKKLKAEYRRSLNLEADCQVVFVTGGGNGAQRLNEAVVQAVTPLLKANSKLYIIHASGREHEAATEQLYDQALEKSEQSRVQVKGFFVNDLYKHSGAADVIITRAGATNLAEFAAQQKCCIIVPNPQLTGGHQTKNADYLAKQKAAVVLSDEAVVSRPQLLTDKLNQLLDNPTKRQQLAKNLSKFANPRASKELAQLILETVA